MSALGVVDFVALWALTREHCRRIVVVPVADEPAKAPVPGVDTPVDAAHTGVVELVVVDSTPEKNALTLPLLGNEVWVSEQVIEDVGVQDRLVL
ncbi:hypothetical protein KKC47_00880 [Patescibacteria group bacterium]|nr:hypothetical protein [Patescibacteria group bacterium]